VIGSTVLRARGLTKRYGRDNALIRAVDEVDLDVPAGQALAVMGPSGCGKSTLLHLLGGLQRPTAGQVWLAGCRIDTMSERALARLRRAAVGFVFQAFHLMDELTAVENVELAALRQTRTATAGPDVVAMPHATGPDALAALASLTTAAGVTGHSGPYPVAFLMLTARGMIVHAVVEGRDDAPATLDRPAVTDGTWVRPGGVVVERTFARRAHRRDGQRGWPSAARGRDRGHRRQDHVPASWLALTGSILTEFGGLVWVDQSDIGALADGQPLSYTLNLKLADPAASAAFVDTSTAATDFTTWQDIADQDGRLVEQAQEALLIGSWLLAALAVAGASGIVAGRIIGQRRRVGLLRAVGAGPAMVAAVHLAEYLVIGLAAAGAGLAAGWLAAPR
jgi:putative ABC transport system permease protein